MWQFLNYSFGLLLAGFVLTGLIGALLSASFQKAAWRRETRLELFRRRYDEGVNLLEELGKLIGRRYFATRQMLWTIERGLDELHLTEVAHALNEATEEWNNRLRMNRAKIRLLVGETQADEFLAYSDDGGNAEQSSLHRAFVDAHQAIVDLSEGRGSEEKAELAVRYLDSACSDFLEELTNNFLRRASSLEILEIPESSHAQGQGPKTTDAA